MAVAKKKGSSKKREKKNIPVGLAFIHATFNNTVISFTDMEGNVICWSSSGCMGFKGSRKGTPFAAQQAAAAAGLTRDRVYLAPLLALEPLLRPSGPDGVHVLLGDAAVTFAAVSGGALVALRSRRRDRSAGEAGRIVAEAVRMAAGFAPPTALAVAFAGTAADDVRREAEHGGVVRVVRGRFAANGSRPAWLEGVLA